MSQLVIWKLAGDQQQSVSWLQHIACEQIIHLILIDFVILDISYQHKLSTH